VCPLSQTLRRPALQCPRDSLEPRHSTCHSGLYRQSVEQGFQVGPGRKRSAVIGPRHVSISLPPERLGHAILLLAQASARHVLWYERPALGVVKLLEYLQFTEQILRSGRRPIPLMATSLENRSVDTDKGVPRGEFQEKPINIAPCPAGVEPPRLNLSRLRRGLCFAASVIALSSVDPSRSRAA